MIYFRVFLSMLFCVVSLEFPIFALGSVHPNSVLFHSVVTREWPKETIPWGRISIRRYVLSFQLTSAL